MKNNNYNCIFATNSLNISNNTNERAIAFINGGPLAPEVGGMVIFISVPGGTEMFAEVYGIEENQPTIEENTPFGFHIHEIGDCSIGDESEPFTTAGGHWNPTNEPHGSHAGDLPVLIFSNGLARMSFFTNKFNVSDVVGKSVIIHQNPDDYRTQPAGASGKRIACGIVKLVI